MSDFISEFWGYYIAAIALVGIVWCVWLLFSQRRITIAPGHAAGEDTGHVWDGDLRELNNPLPRWWMWMFLLSCIFALAYLILYPGLGAYGGVLGFSTRSELASQRAAAEAQVRPLYERYGNMDIKQIAADPQAHEIGQRLFLNNCAQCHGSDAGGSKGFPNLTDNDWLGDNSLDAVKKTIVEGRVGMMPPMAAAVGSSEDLKNLANYVLSLSGSAHNDIAAQLGKPKFATCAACHGADGKGNRALGAPNLTDKVWLHGWGEKAIVTTVTGGINNVMPAQGRLLTPEQVHVLAGYVLSLSRGTVVAAQ
jgi:cytochrome c oxidase cbb3-type subunit 3